MTDPHMIPFAAYESAQERNSRTLKNLFACWAISIIMVAMALCTLLAVSLSYEYETVTETTEVAQDADNYGSNYYAGGDMNSDSTPDDQGY